MLDQHQIYEQVLFDTFGPSVHFISASLVAAGNHNQGVQLNTSEGSFFLKLNFDHERDILKKRS